MSKDGGSANFNLGEEQYEKCEIHKDKPYIQYVYRHTDGEHFCCVMPTLAECRVAKDNWLDEKNGVKPYEIKRKLKNKK